MAVRQYVGARYVPKFADPVAWQSGTSYEALTIVTYNNSSYTSKISVPATVGNPADNDTYWALTGNYNAQVEDYRQATLRVQKNLNETNQNIDKINDKYYIIIGDSWGAGQTAGGYSNGWIARLLTMLDYKEEYHTYYGGSGFVATGTGSTTNTYLYLLQQLANTITDKDKITDIVVGGTINDSGHSVSDIHTAVINFMTYVETTFPNAKVHIIAFSSRNAAIITESYLGGYAVDDPKCLFTNVSKLARFGDYTETNHLNATGYNYIAQCVKNILNNMELPHIGRTKIIPVSSEYTTYTTNANFYSIDNVTQMYLAGGEFPLQNNPTTDVTGCFDFLFKFEEEENFVPSYNPNFQLAMERGYIKAGSNYAVHPIVRVDTEGIHCQIQVPAGNQEITLINIPSITCFWYR